MENVKKYIGYLFSAFVGATAWVGSINFLPVIGSADPKVIAAIVTVCGTLITGVILALINQRNGKKREIEAQKSISERELQVQKQIREREIEESHRERKVAIYLEFVNLVSAFMQGHNRENKKKPLNQQQILDKIEKFQNGILLWGGPSVLKAYLNYRINAGKGSNELFPSIDALYRAIREDIGLSNNGLEKFDTVRLYLKDPAELDQLLDITNHSSKPPTAGDAASSASA